jgi:hypothetical protein
MPVTINEVRSEVHAFDASALLTEEVLRVLTRRVADEIRRMATEDAIRARDKVVTEGRRAQD